MLLPAEPKILFLALLVLFVVLLAIVLMLPYSRTTVTVISGKDKVSVAAEIAGDPVKQARGLMFRESLAKGQGMIFVYSDEKPRSFWMKNTLIPLDLIFADISGKIVDITENFLPCEEFECPRYVSKPAAYVLEVNAGFVKENKIKIGDEIKTGI